MTASKQCALPEPAIPLPSTDMAPHTHTPTPTGPPAITLSSGEVALHEASPEPMHPLPGQPAVPSLPDCELPRPAVTLLKSDVVTHLHAPGVPITPHACTPTMDVHTMLCTCTPVSPTEGPMPITTPPQAATKHTPTTIIHGPHDLSILHSDTPNPWGNLCHRQRSCHSYKPHQSIHQRRQPSVYPVNHYIHTPPSQPLPSFPNQIFKRITHPFGIGPTKPVI